MRYCTDGAGNGDGDDVNGNNYDNNIDNCNDDNGDDYDHNRYP